MKKIALTRGQFALVDNEDFEYLNQFKWQAIPLTRGGFTTYYASRKEYSSGPTIYMHKVILGTDSIVDHKDGNPLNNRRSNLRKATISQNNANRKATGSSQYLGVSISNDKKKWVANICCDHKKHYLGRYSSEKDAAKAYNEAAKRFHGEFAKLNRV